MSKKDYIRAAAITCATQNEDSKVSIAAAFVQLFESDSSRFNSFKFLKACQVDVDLVKKLLGR